MISAASITAVVVIGIVFVFACLCSSIIFCCCALSSWNLCATLLCCGIFMRQKHPRYIITNRSNNRNNLQSSSAASPLMDNDDEMVLADAYLIPPLAPLAEVTIINDISPLQQGNHLNFNQIQCNPSSQMHVLENGNQIDNTVRQYGKQEFKDIWAAVLFVLQVIVIIGLAVHVCLKSLKVTNTTDIQSGGLGKCILYL